MTFFIKAKLKKLKIVMFEMDILTFRYRLYSYFAFNKVSN